MHSSFVFCDLSMPHLAPKLYGVSIVLQSAIHNTFFIIVVNVHSIADKTFYIFLGWRPNQRRHLQNPVWVSHQRRRQKLDQLLEIFIGKPVWIHKVCVMLLCYTILSPLLLTHWAQWWVERAWYQWADHWRLCLLCVCVSICPCLSTVTLVTHSTFALWKMEGWPAIIGRCHITG